MHFILASASPRRQELLRQIGLAFSVMPSGIDESVEPSAAPDDPKIMVRILAERKIDAVIRRGLPPETIVIGADTVVVLNGKVYGKPSDANEACRMLSELSGREHCVITGVAAAKEGRLVSDVCTTLVRLCPLSDEEIRRYVASGEPLDKAGAYGIQGLGALIVDSISGCYFNVVGLPLVTLSRLLRDLGVRLL